MPKPDSQHAGNRLDISSEHAVSHSAIQQKRYYPSVDNPRVTLEDLIAIKPGAYLAIPTNFEIQSQTWEL